METAVTLHADYRVYSVLSDEDLANGRALMKLRCSLGLYLHEAAELLQLNTVELSECERGIRRFDLEDARAVLLQRA